MEVENREYYRKYLNFSSKRRTFLFDHGMCKNKRTIAIMDQV